MTRLLLQVLLLVVAAPAQAEDGGTSAPQSADAAAPAEATPLAASIEARPTAVKLGEPLELFLQARGEGAAKLTLPASLDLKPCTEIGRELSGAEDGRLLEIRLKVACYEKVGPIELRGIKLVAATQGGAVPPLEMPPVQVTVSSVLQGIDKPEARDVAGPMTVIVEDYRPLWVIGLLAAWLLLGLLARRRIEPEAPNRLEDLPPPRLAHEIALEKLEAIVAEDLLGRGERHAYFTRISETVREYIGNRYGFFALDLTSAELVAVLRGRLTQGLDLGALDTLLVESDLVKFARKIPDDIQCSSLLNRAYGLIDATRVREEPERRVPA